MTDILTVPYEATLTSFGSPAARKHVRARDFVLQGNNGGWVTIPNDQYELDKKNGIVRQRSEDADGNDVDWESYSSYRWSGTIVASGARTTITNEALTFADADYYEVAAGPDDQIQDELASDSIFDDDDFSDETQSDNYVAGVSGYFIDRVTGNAEFNNITARGTIIASAGTIGGWTINATSLTGGNATLHSSGYLLLGTSNDIVRLDATDATYRIWVGNAVAESAPFRVSKLGAMTATSGTIGGFTLGATTLTATNLTLDSSNQEIRLGSGNNIITLDAADATYRLSVGHATHSSAPFHVTQAGEVTARNITATGTIKATVFQKALVSAFAGSLLVAKSASALDSSATATGTTFTVVVKTQAGAPFASGDYIYITDGINATWATVGAPSGTGPYTYTATYASGSSSATYEAGMTVIDYGQSGQGYLYATADNADGPYYSVRTWTMNPYTGGNVVERARMGNLRNSFGIGANNYYGFAAGDYSAGNYLRYDPTNGFVIKAAGGALQIDGTKLTLNGIDGGGTNAGYVQWVNGSSTRIAQLIGEYGTGTSAGAAAGVEVLGYSDTSGRKGFVQLTAVGFTTSNSPAARVTSDGVVALDLRSGSSTAISTQGLVVSVKTSATTGGNTSFYTDYYSSGTVANDYGGAWTFRIQSSTGEIQSAGIISTLWTDATNATRHSRMEFSVFDVGAPTKAFVISRDGVGVFTTPNAGTTFHIAQPVETSGTPQLARFIGGAHTTLAAGTEAVDVLFGLGRTVQFSAGALALQRAVRFDKPVYAFTSASTITNAATVSIDDAPVAGTNATITNRWALLIQAGNTGFGGHVLFPTDNTYDIGASGANRPRNVYVANNYKGAGSILSSSSSAGIGYATGAGGTVTQTTSKSTAVTLNKISGKITMHSEALAAGAIVKFTFNNSTIDSTDVVVAIHGSAGTFGSYVVVAGNVRAGACSIQVQNISSVSLSQNIVIHYVVIKAVQA